MPRRPGTAAASASRAPCLAVAQIERIMVRSTPYFSASSRWVAEEVNTEVNTSYFCEGASFLRLRRARGWEPPAAAEGFGLVMIKSPCPVR